jgi:hypothetical protein
MRGWGEGLDRGSERLSLAMLAAARAGLSLHHKLRTMDIAALKLELVQRVLAVQDKAMLDRLREVIDTDAEDGEISAEELAELESLREERLRGEGTSYSWEDVQRMAREMIKK